MLLWESPPHFLQPAALAVPALMEATAAIRMASAAQATRATVSLVALVVAAEASPLPYQGRPWTSPVSHCKVDSAAVAAMVATVETRSPMVVSTAAMAAMVAPPAMVVWVERLHSQAAT